MNSEMLMAQRFLERHPEAVARHLNALPSEDVGVFLESITAERRIALVGFMVPDVAASFVRALPVEHRYEVAEGLPIELAAAMVRRLSDEERQDVLAGVTEPRRRRLERALRYSAGTAGGLANVDAPTVPEGATVEAALKRSHKRGPDLPYVYVMDREHRLVGVVSRRELGQAPSAAQLREIMNRDVRRLSAFTSLGELRSHPAWHELDVLPVVDGAGVLLGVLTHKALRRRVGAPGSSAAGREGPGGSLGLGTAYCDLLARVMVSVTTPPAEGRDGASGGGPS